MRGSGTWRSIWGLKSESCMITVSAAVRLIPIPPARVERRNTCSGNILWRVLPRQSLKIGKWKVRDRGGVRGTDLDGDVLVEVVDHVNFLGANRLLKRYLYSTIFVFSSLLLSTLGRTLMPTSLLNSSTMAWSSSCHLQHEPSQIGIAACSNFRVKLDAAIYDS